MKSRESFSSRLGFILVSAGCAIGLGNVWRFPYITGQYGGAAFVLLYLVFLVLMGLPTMAMEFSVGRASRASIACSYGKLEPKGTKWHIGSVFGIIGNYLLMMFYTTVAGWMIYYVWRMASGAFEGATAEVVGNMFDNMLGEPVTQVGWMTVSILLGFSVCALGLQKGVERITKVMMCSMFVIMIALAIHSVMLPGAQEGLKFYLVPDFSRMAANGLGDAIFAAMGQAFFTLSLGIGAMAIFGSYIGKDQSLTGESINICLLDTLVAFIAGLIIFPACTAYGVDPGQGPGLVFVTLPNIFNQMAGGRFWGTLFFVFMSFAALSTVVAVFENILSFGMDRWGWSRKKSVIVNLVLVFVLSLPCALGFNVWSGFAPFGPNTFVQDLEDFIISNNLLPLGSLLCVMFCTSRRGWGWDNFIAECNQGKGTKFPAFARKYVTYVLPVMIIVIFIFGYIDKFFG